MDSLEALYAAVEQDRGALERWSVLCDALLQAGEVHGELMAYQLRDEAQRAVPSWFRPTVGSIADFLKVHREALLGPLADPALAVSWRRGFIDFIRIGHRPGPPPLAALEALQVILPGELTAEQLHRALERGPARGDSLHVSGYDSTVSIARLLTAWPHVASIEVSTPFELELVRSMNLRELRLRGPESDVVLFLEENQFPTLRSLAALHREYWRRPAGSTWVDLPPALGSGRFPRLENLEVSGVVKPRLIVRLAQTSVAQQLKTLRLEAAFDLNTVDALAEARPFFPRLERLHLVGHSSPFPRVDRRELERRFAGVRVTVEHR